MLILTYFVLIYLKNKKLMSLSQQRLYKIKTSFSSFSFKVNHELLINFEYIKVMRKVI